MIVDIRIKGIWFKADILGIESGGWSDLTADTTVDIDGHLLMFTDDGGDNELLRIEPKGVSLLAKDVFSTVQINMTANDGVNTTLQLRSDLSPTDESEIILDGAISQITHTGKVHLFNAGGNPYLTLDSGIFQSVLKADDGDAFSMLNLNADLAGNNVSFSLAADDDTNEIGIEGDAQANSITQTAASNNFIGAIQTGGVPGLTQDIVLAEGTLSFTNGLLTAFVAA